MLPRRSAALTCFCQGSCHLVLGGVDVAGRPAALRSQRTQRLNQHLWDRGVSRAGTAQHSTAQPSTAQHSTAQHSLLQWAARDGAGSSSSKRCPGKMQAGRTSVRGFQECGGVSSNSPRDDNGEKPGFPTLDAQIRSHSPQSVL